MSRRWTVVQLIPALRAGGAERSVLEIGAALVAAGHRSIVISAGGTLVEPLLAHGSEHIQLAVGRKSLHTVVAARLLRRQLQAVRPDIVHVRSRLPAWLAHWALAGIQPRPALVSTVHGLNSPGRYSAIMVRGDAVIAVSETVREYLLKHYSGQRYGAVSAERWQVIARGIDPQAFPHGYQASAAWQAQFAQQFPTLAGGRLLVLPGRGTRLKGHRHGLGLLATLRRDGIDARLWMPGVVESGREAYLAELQQLATELGIGRYVVFSPSRADIRDIYARADLVLQLSDQPEAFGRTVLEALALGRPVLGFAHGGVGELLARYYPSGAVTPGADAELAERAKQLLLAAPTPAPIEVNGLAAMQAATLQLYRDLLLARDHRDA